MEILHSLLMAFEAYPLVGLGIFAAAIIARQATKRDLDKWDIGVALLNIATAAAIAAAPGGGRLWFTLALSGIAFVLTLAMVLPWPAFSWKWAVVADGAPMHRVVGRHGKQRLIKVQDSGADFAEWSQENRTRRRAVVVLLIAVFAALYSGRATLVVFAVPLYGIAGLAFGWSQFVRLNYLPRYAPAAARAADPTPQQPQGEGRRRRDGIA